MSINLLPTELRKTKKIFSNKSIFVKIIAFYVIFFMITNGLLWLRITYLEHKVAEGQILKNEIETVKGDLELFLLEKELISEQKEVLKEVLDKKSYAAEMFQKIQNSLPQKISLTRVYFGNKGQVLIFGKTKSVETIKTFLDNLESQQIFGHINLSELKLAVDTGVNFFQIEILAVKKEVKEQNDQFIY